jgi:hypothetical protein
MTCLLQGNKSSNNAFHVSPDRRLKSSKVQVTIISTPFMLQDSSTLVNMIM